MRLDQVINGYKIIAEPKNSGNCMWSFARKGSKEFFIKEFLNPTFVETGPPAIVAKRKKACVKFEAFHRSLIEAFKTKGEETGNIIFPIDFFRFETKYYKVTDKVEVFSTSFDEIARLSFEKKIILLKTVAHSLGILHRCNIVHSDLKPDNILIKATEKALATKLIDFDASYFSGAPPDPDETIGDPTYYSPELSLYIKGGTSATNVTLKSDVFALGLIFSQYLTGQLPLGITAKMPAHQVVSEKGKIEFSASGVPQPLVNLINAMLLLKAESRPSIEAVFEALKKGGLPEPVKENKLTIRLGGSGSTLPPKVSAPATKTLPPIEPAPPENRLKGSLLKKPKE